MSTKNTTKTEQIRDRLVQSISHIIPKISKKTGWKDQVIRRWVNGGLPGIDKIDELCEAAGISPIWLLTGIEDTVAVVPIQAEAQAEHTQLHNIPANETSSDDADAVVDAVYYVIEHGTTEDVKRMRKSVEFVKTKIESKKKQLSQQPQIPKVLQRAA